jgi:hypothetical protein
MPDDERADDSRECILQVATGLFAEHGYYSTSMRALSNAAQAAPFDPEQIDDGHEISAQADLRDGQLCQHGCPAGP